MSNTTLVSLAFLKTNWDVKRSSFLDNFVPFAAECLKDFSDDVVSTQALQECILGKFGLRIPLQVTKALINRLRKKGMVTISNHVAYRNPAKLDDVSFITTQQKVLRFYSALINDTIRFASEKYHVVISEHDAEDILLAFIGFNQVTIFQTDPAATIIPNVPGLNKRDKLLISDYINHIHKTDPQMLSYLETLFVGYMIVNALYLPDPQNINRKFQKTKFFFDTSFIIYALGYSGDEMCAPSLELLDLLYINGAQLYCFRHTLEEIERILFACSSKLGMCDESPFGRSVQYFTSRGYSQSDVQLLISKLERNLEYLRIKVLDKPDYSDHKFVIDEKGFSESLKAGMISPKDDAIARDVDSIAAIFRLRKGRMHFNIEDSEAIFVTTSSTLASTSQAYYYKENDPNTLPPCLTDYTLTNLVWLKTPMQAPALPTQRVIADCYAAVQPNDALMAKWVNEIEKLERQSPLSQEDYFFMRYSSEVRTALMEVSLGNPDAITDGTVPQILERARHKITEEADKLLEDEKGKRIEAENEKYHLVRNHQLQEDKRLEKRRNITHRVAKSIVTFIRFGSLILLLGGAILSFPFDLFQQGLFGQLTHGWPKIALFAVLLIAFLFNLANQIWGIAVVSVVNKIELLIQDRVSNWLKSVFD